MGLTVGIRLLLVLFVCKRSIIPGVLVPPEVLNCYYYDAEDDADGDKCNEDGHQYNELLVISLRLRGWLCLR